MRALGVDTTTPGGSLALCEDDRLLGAVTGDIHRTHGERLLGDIDSLLAAHGWRPADIDVYGVAAGPGSFTGLRIGIATVQGLAMVHDRPVVAVSALDALAGAGAAATAPLGASQDESPVLAAWLDAHRGEVFWALYTIPTERGRRGQPVLAAGPSVEAPLLVLERWSQDLNSNLFFVGDGAVRYQPEIVGLLGHRAIVSADVPLTAPFVAAMALQAAARGEAVAPGAVRPLYVRRPDAELARDARARQVRG